MAADSKPAVDMDDSAKDAIAVANTEAPKAHSATPVAEPLPKPPAMSCERTLVEALSREVAPWPANSPKLMTGFKSSGHDELPDAEARRWLASVEGQPFNWSTESIGNPVRRIAKFHGIAKLRRAMAGRRRPSYDAF